MSQRIIDNVSVFEIGITDAASPVDALTFVVSGSPNSAENRTWNLAFFSERVQLNRVLKKRYATYTQAGSPQPLVPCHVRNVAELIAQAGG